VPPPGNAEQHQASEQRNKGEKEETSKSLHTPPGNQIGNLLYSTNLNPFYVDSLPAFLAKGLDRLDEVIACNPVARGCVPMSSPQALIVVLLWALILAGVSTVLFLRRDVLQ
jgi:hypothetical protein